jgi:site-specific recombinase XerD
LQNTLRDQVIILFLLDTGVRASELCKLRVSDIGKDGVYVRGKGSKDRIVPMSDTVRAALQEYLGAKKRKAGDRVFQTIQGNPMTPSSLRGVIKRMARRAGVPKAHPHRFRHTFAINFLRNGGDVFSLQRILGHETLDMVKRYLAIAKSDISLAHAKVSPVTR